MKTKVEITKHHQRKDGWMVFSMLRSLRLEISCEISRLSLNTHSIVCWNRKECLLWTP